MADVEFDDKELKQRLESLKSKGKNIGQLAGEVAQMLLVAVEDEFESQGKGEWAPLNPATTARHPRRSGGKILQDTGELVGSFKPNSGSDYAEVVSGNPYGGYHVSGTKNMPARDFTDLDYDELSLQIGDLLLREITG